MIKMSSSQLLKVGCVLIVEDTVAGRRWGFPSNETLKEEMEYLKSNVKKLEESLEGVEFSDFLVVKSENDVIANSEKLVDADVLLVFMFIGGAPAYAEVGKLYKTYGHSLEAVWGFGKPTVIFTRAEGEHMYDGNMRALALIEEHRDVTGKSLWVVVNDWGYLCKVVKVLQAIKRIKNTTVITVGPPSSSLGSYNAMRAVAEKMDVKVIMSHFEEVIELYNSVKKEEVGELVRDFLEKAKGLMEITKERVIDEATKSARLYLACKRLMKEKGAEVITFNCYEGGLKVLKEVAPCFALSKLNDEGFLGVCESDFAAMAMMLLARYIADKPSFLADVVVIPEKNQLLLAHCSCPTKLKGLKEDPEPYYATTQYETAQAITTKVLMSKGQVVTILVPSFDLKEVVLMRGTIVESPNLPVCRNQAIVEISGDVTYLLEKYPGFHCVMLYGDHVREFKMACKILGMKAIELH